MRDKNIDELEIDGKIDWSALEEHWANDYSDVYAPKK